MATETTELRIKVNARDVDTLGQKIKRALSDRVGKMFNRSMWDVNKALRDNVAETERIVRAMQKVDRESEAYARLAQRLNRANQEAKQLQQTLQRVGGGGGGPRGGGGGGGRGLRGAPMLPMPGMGALGTAFMGLPIIGGLLAGAVGASSSAFSSYSSLQQTQMQVAPYLMNSRAALGYTPEMYRPGVQRSMLGTAGHAGVRSMITGAFGPLGVDDYIEGKQGRARARVPFDRAGMTAVGQGFGVKPQQAIMQAAVLSQSMYGPAGAGDLEQALAARQVFGIGTGQLGAFRGAMRRTGYGPDAGNRNEVTMTLMTAVKLGLEASEVAEYMQQQTGFLKSLESQGLRASNAELQAINSGVAATGIRGFRAQSITQGFARGAIRVGQQGMQSAADVRLMRAMGYTGRGGAEEYAKYMMMAQDPGIAARYMPEYVQSFTRGMDPNSDYAAMMVQRAMGKMGVQLGPVEARQMALGGSAFKKGMAGSVGATASYAELNGIEGIMARSGRQIAGVTGSTVVEQAGIEQLRIEAGAKVARSMLDLERSVVDIANSFGNALAPAVEELTAAIKAATGAVSESTEGTWLPSLPSWIRP